MGNRSIHANPNMHKPYAESCDQNGPPILDVLRAVLEGPADLLEIGSGTGQHAVMFARALPQVGWQTSDRIDMHAGIRLWLEEAGLDNVHAPIPLNVLQDPWPERQYDAVFSANTAHIMAPEAVRAMFAGVARVLGPDGLFLLYGPFMYDGRHTSESNQEFDYWLRSRESHQGVRDVTWLRQIAAGVGLALAEDVAMPANNRILMWRPEAD